KFVEEHGRTYHKFNAGKYTLPNDQVTNIKADLQHTLFTITLDGKLYLAPVNPNIRSILDIATGTGIWAIEIAKRFPKAQVVGTDLSPIQPDDLPKNCRFEVSDAELPWPFTDKFDFIHGRALLACFRDPRYVFSEAFKSLAPGGYVELQDVVQPYFFLGEHSQSSNLHRWSELTCEGSAKIGRSWTNVPNYKRWMEELGFVDIVERDFYWPSSRWAEGEYYKKIASIYSKNMCNGVEGMSLKVMGSLGWTAEEVRSFMAEVRKDFCDVDVFAYVIVKVVYGRKPVE
ncbi:S-adenosyl-L-methionine-dependent methyltransferase, partial [Stipitochalara longipes BDJ]